VTFCEENPSPPSTFQFLDEENEPDQGNSLQNSNLSTPRNSMTPPGPGSSSNNHSSSGGSGPSSSTPRRTLENPKTKAKLQFHMEEEEESNGSTTILIEAPEGDYEATIPENEDNITLELPRNLRNRGKIQPPVRYQARLANSISSSEPKTYKEAMLGPDKEEWKKAMEEEYSSLVDKGTWEIIQKPRGAKVLDAKWVFKIKKNADGNVERYKARLCIRGFRQQFEIDYFETFSTVCRYESIRLILALAAAEGWSMMQFDIKTAFLNGDLEEEVFMEQPEGFTNGHPE